MLLFIIIYKVYLGFNVPQITDNDRLDIELGEQGVLLNVVQITP